MSNLTLFDSFCKSCGNTEFVHVIEAPGSYHYGRNNCKTCGKFHNWIPKPKPQISISKLLQSPSLLGWEKAFLKNLTAKRIWSRGEKIMLQEIHDRLNPI